jgi:phytoene dehydrogenase-like protein
VTARPVLGKVEDSVTAAGRGRQVLVLESDGSPGGYAQCFHRGPLPVRLQPPRVERAGAGWWHGRHLPRAGIWDRVHLRRLDPLYVARFPDHEIVAHADVYRYESDLIGQFPDEKVGIRAYLDEASAVYRDSIRVYADGVAGRPAALEDFVTRYPTLVSVSGETWAQTITRHVDDPRLVAVLGALWPYTGLPPQLVASVNGSVMSMPYGHHGGWYPEGGSGAVAWALEGELHARGGEVRYSQTAARVDVRDGRVTAVETTEGLRVEADVVISDASAPATMLEMVGRGHLPDDYVARVEAPGASYTIFNVYLGLKRDVFGEQHLPHELFVSPGYDSLAQREAALSGDWGQAGIALTDYTRVDPGCAPEGGGVVVLSAMVDWNYADVWGTGGDLAGYHENPAYLAVKERVADELVSLADVSVPGLAGAVGFREASTPLTNFAYTHNPLGAIEGYENTPANSGLGWLPQTTPIHNLFLAGAWTNGGGQNPAIQSGRSAAELALAALA